jgi:2-desacetyl-2-hydroxyethyl bacteriochlorophyllide A dehydrogenase
MQAGCRRGKMKAAVFHGPLDIRVEEVPTPDLEPGDILIKVRACGICGSDLHAYKLGLFPELGLPLDSGMILGHEFSGEIVEIAGEQEGFQVGDRVTAMSMGAEAEYVKIPWFLASLVHKFSPDISYEEAATCEPLATSLNAVNLAGPADDETHVILGVGGIGLGVLQVIKARCSTRVVAVDLSDKRLDTARKLGADEVINATREDPYQRVLEMTGSTKLLFVEELAGNVDTVYDCAGCGRNQEGTPALFQAIRMARSRAKVLLVATYEKQFGLDYNLVMNKALTLLGSFGDATVVDDFAQSVDLVVSRRIDRKPLITHTFPLDEAKEAYETQLRADEAIKVLIKP